MASRALADRGVALSTADSLARKGETLTLDQILSFPGRSVGEQAEQMDAAKASTQDALGWSAVKAGRLDDAEKYFAKGLELTKRDANLYLHLGRLRMVQGRASDAELAWAEGMTVKARGVNPNRSELEALYRRQRGSLDGWQAYVASLEEKERTMRKARILAKREAKPFVPPALVDVQLSGDSVKLAELRGKTVVLNFWGTWCGPCVAEMPELQQFYDKYKNDSTVRILTVANDDQRETLVKWMADRKVTIPTVWNKSFPIVSGVNGWPTTWFIGPDGYVQYQMIGNAGQLVEEWSWLVEAVGRGSGRTP
jgi:thiol-disulfide isomerase/thioredoxin